MYKKTENKLDNIRVAKVLNAYEVVINKGKSDGITYDDTFYIHRFEEEIIDPVTKLPLERLEHIVGPGKVGHIQDKIATITSTKHKTNIMWSLKLATGEEADYLPFDTPKCGDEVILKRKAENIAPELPNTNSDKQSEPVRSKQQ